ncbi:hypothetical protein ACLKA7_011204 [Drosophila subpalustris]
MGQFIFSVVFSSRCGRQLGAIVGVAARESIFIVLAKSRHRWPYFRLGNRPAALSHPVHGGAVRGGSGGRFTGH